MIFDSISSLFKREKAVFFFIFFPQALFPVTSPCIMKSKGTNSSLLLVEPSECFNLKLFFVHFHVFALILHERWPDIIPMKTYWLYMDVEISG